MESPWHVGQREEPVEPQGHVLCVDPQVGRPETKDFLFILIHCTYCTKTGQFKAKTSCVLKLAGFKVI